MISKEEANPIQKLSHSIITANLAVASKLYRERNIYSSEKEMQSAVFRIKTVANEVIWAIKIL